MIVIEICALMGDIVFYVLDVICIIHIIMTYDYFKVL